MTRSYVPPDSSNQCFDLDELQESLQMSVDLSGFGQQQAQQEQTEGSPPGQYPGLGVLDETKRYGALGLGQGGQQIHGVVLHQTGGSADSTGSTYDKRIAGKIDGERHTGAHYLIDSDGKISLTVPTDKEVIHVKNQAKSKGLVGIENVGMPVTLDRTKDLREQIRGMNLAPQLRERLLAMKDKELASTLAANINVLYGDISGPQKRSTWKLLRRLAAEHNLDLSADVFSHKELDHRKKLGEGENEVEFVQTMLQYPKKVEALRRRISDLEAEGNASTEALGELYTILEEETATQAALEADGTEEEQDAADIENILGIETGAGARDQLCADFYDEFYERMARLDAALDNQSHELGSADPLTSDLSSLSGSAIASPGPE